MPLLIAGNFLFFSCTIAAVSAFLAYLLGRKIKGRPVQGLISLPFSFAIPISIGALIVLSAGLLEKGTQYLAAGIKVPGSMLVYHFEAGVEVGVIALASSPISYLIAVKRGWLSQELPTENPQDTLNTQTKPSALATLGLSKKLTLTLVAMTLSGVIFFGYLIISNYYETAYGHRSYIELLTETKQRHAKTDLLFGANVRTGYTMPFAWFRLRSDQFPREIQLKKRVWSKYFPSLSALSNSDFEKEIRRRFDLAVERKREQDLQEVKIAMFWASLFLAGVVVCSYLLILGGRWCYRKYIMLGRPPFAKRVFAISLIWPLTIAAGLLSIGEDLRDELDIYYYTETLLRFMFVPPIAFVICSAIWWWAIRTPKNQLR